MMFNLWKRLQRVTHYEYESAPGSNSQMGWNGQGAGDVTVERDDSAAIVYFKEQGQFTLAESGHTLNTENEFIWQRISDGRIKLLHSRLGRDNPVELFDLVYDTATDEWLSEAAHACGEDLYSGKAAWNDGAIEFSWFISGPRKEENLHYSYRR